MPKVAELPVLRIPDGCLQLDCCIQQAQALDPQDHEDAHLHNHTPEQLHPIGTGQPTMQDAQLLKRT